MLKYQRTLPRMLVLDEVARRGSFTAAAEALGQTPSAISQQISALERELGVRLLHRSTRQLRLTAAGEGFAERCRQLVDLARLACDEVGEQAQKPRGPLVVTAPHALSESLLIPALARLCVECPGVEPELRTADERLDLLANRVDVAVSVGVLPENGMVARRLGEVVEVLCGSPGYLATHGTPVSPESLASHRLLVAPWQSRGFLLYGPEKRQVEITTAHPLRANTLNTIVALAEQGLGVALIPQPAAIPSLRLNRLLPVLPAWRSAPHAVHAVHPYGRQAPRHVQRLLDLLLQEMRRLDGRAP